MITVSAPPLHVLAADPSVPKLDIANPHRLMFGVRYRSTTPTPDNKSK